MSTRPLYLYQRECQVQLEGPSLRVSCPEQAARLFPLQYLSRVVVGPEVEWQTEALRSCARAGITVVFTNRDGVPEARLLGRSGSQTELRQRLIDLFDREDGELLYRQWFEATERRLAIETARRFDLGVPLDRFDVTGFHRRLQMVEDTFASKAIRSRVGMILYQALHADMVMRLQEQGLGAADELFQHQNPPLVNDLSRLANWHLIPIRFGWLQRRSQWARRRNETPKPPTTAQVIKLYETHRSRLQRQQRFLLSRLHRWLMEVA